MAFLYAAVARETTVLAQESLSSGNFDVIAVDILGRVTSTQSVFQEGPQTYFVLNQEGGLNFVVVGTSPSQSVEAFQLAEKVQRGFHLLPDFRSWQTVPAYGFQSEFAEQILTLLQPPAREQIVHSLEMPLLGAEPSESDRAIATEVDAGQRRQYAVVFGIAFVLLFTMILLLVV
jgi:hypothetical protein